MDTASFRQWLEARLQISEGLKALGEGAEADAEILLCCVISALAAAMWPGDRIDRFRFVEFLVRFADPSHQVKRISVPLLVAQLRANKKTNEMVRLKDEFYPGRRELVVTGEEIDQSEVKVLRALKGVARKDIREASYAGVLYSEFRSPLIHTYRLSRNLEPWGVSERTDVPTYVNLHKPNDPTEVQRYARRRKVSEAEAVLTLTSSERYLYFPYRYVRSVVTSAAEGAFGFWEGARKWRGKCQEVVGSRVVMKASNRPLELLGDRSNHSIRPRRPAGTIVASRGLPGQARSAVG